MRLALGTVQFGMPYGIARRGGRPSPAEIDEILETASACGIDLLDTAPSYGDCEALLGRASAARRFRIVTKTRYYDGAADIDDATDGVAATFARSLAALKRDSAYAVLIHSVADAIGDDAARIVGALQDLKSRGKIAKIGLTVYEPADLERFRFLADIDVVQLPLNILDQRFRAPGVLAELRRRNIEVHARSAFLQGLLLMAPDAIPSRIAVARPRIERLRSALERGGLDPLAGALGFLRSVPELDYVLLGVDNARQLRDIAAAADAPCAVAFAEFACDDADIIDPRRWPKEP